MLYPRRSQAVSGPDHGPHRDFGAQDPGLPGGRPLKNRRNLILSRTPGFSPEGAQIFSSLEELLAAAEEDAFVIGGESVYRALLPRCDTAYVTKIDAAFPSADAFFPDLDADPDWQEAEEGEPQTHEELSFRYVTYRRVK